MLLSPSGDEIYPDSCTLKCCPLINPGPSVLLLSPKFVGLAELPEEEEGPTVLLIHGFS